MSKTKRLPEFPTDWHQEAHGEALERELLGYQRRQAELAAMGVAESDKAFADAVSGEEAVKAELVRLGRGQGSASKRPRQAAETRSADVVAASVGEKRGEEKAAGGTS